MPPALGVRWTSSREFREAAMGVSAPSAPADRSRMASAVSGAASGVVVSACLQPLVSR